MPLAASIVFNQPHGSAQHTTTLSFSLSRQILPSNMYIRTLVQDDTTVYSLIPG